MTIPTPNEMKIPILKYLSQTEEPVKLVAIIEALARFFNITKQEQEERMPSGGKRFSGNVGVIVMRLKSSDFLKSPRYGYWEITEKGRDKIRERGTMEAGDMNEKNENMIKQNDVIKKNQYLLMQLVEHCKRIEMKLDTEKFHAQTTSANKFYIQMVTEIVKAHLSTTPVPTDQLPKFFKDTYKILTEVISSLPVAPTVLQEPAVSIDESVTGDYIICLEDGKKFEILSKHLRDKYNMTPEQYREKWNLAPDYPMVAPECAKTQPDLVKEASLGYKPVTVQKKTT